MAPISIGEIHVPGGAGLASARTFTLTNPSAGGLELLFGMFVAEAPKRVVEKLCDRLSEEFRPIFFRPGDPEARFEAALKQANKTILAFLYEHGLSLPGVKLRGSVTALSGGRLYAAARGSLRGTLYVPDAGRLAPHALFDDAPEKPGEPKFFTSLQVGTFPAGARFVVSTSELCQALDDAFVDATLAQPDFAKASREIKHALRAGRWPVSLLALSSPMPEGGAAAVAPTGSPAPKPFKPQGPIVGPDLGELASHWLRLALLFFGRAFKAIGLGLWAALRWLAKLPLKLPSLIRALANPAARASLVASVRTAPGRAVDAAVGRLNALPERGRAHFLVLLLAAAVFVHGVIFSFRHEMTLRDAKAYEASLAELQNLEGDFESGILYENEARSREILSRMESLAAALPEDNANRQKAKADAHSAIARAKEKLRRAVTVAEPPVFATLDEAAAFAPSAMAWFDGTLYVFSSNSGRVAAFTAEGAKADIKEVTAMASGVAQAAPARTGFILKDAAGKTAYWNPATGETVEHPDAGLGAAPILFYQSRLYAAAADGSVTRRPVGTASLGAAADVLRGAPANPTSIATDGAVYLLYADGSTRKWLRGAAVSGYAPSAIDPLPSSAAQLWASADASRLFFIERGGGRAFSVDKASGRLLAQMSSPKFSNLLAATSDGKGNVLYLLDADGTIYAVPTN